MRLGIYISNISLDLCMHSRPNVNTSKQMTAAEWWLSRIVSVGRQSVRMGFAWSGLGLLIGANSTRIQGGDTLGLIPQIIGWAIMMGLMGGLLGLLGGKVRLVLPAAACGLLIGLQADWSLGYAWPQAQANNGLLLGAIVGTTIGPWLNMYVQAAKGIRAVLAWVLARPLAESESP